MFFFIVTLVQAQHQININATLVPESKTIVIEQELIYKNNSEKVSKFEVKNFLLILNY